MDTIIFVVTMIGASLMMALLFASTVLSYKWWNLPLVQKHLRSKNSQQKRDRSNNELIPQHKVIEAKPQSQNLVQLKHINWSELMNKIVKTCEMVDVGQITIIDKHSMTVIHESKQKYNIPTYYIRECDKQNVVVDISIRYLHHYRFEEKSQY
ncbi:MAG: hypothetical protein WCC82_08750 [Nitrososphaeraceae archaeon]